jgi:hypothetical protein
MITSPMGLRARNKNGCADKTSNNLPRWPYRTVHCKLDSSLSGQEILSWKPKINLCPQKPAIWSYPDCTQSTFYLPCCCPIFSVYLVQFSCKLLGAAAQPWSEISPRPDYWSLSARSQKIVTVRNLRRRDIWLVDLLSVDWQVCRWIDKPLYSYCVF